MAEPVGVPWHRGRTGTPRPQAPPPDGRHRATRETPRITWSDLADAVWLASVIDQVIDPGSPPPRLEPRSTNTSHDVVTPRTGDGPNTPGSGPSPSGGTETRSRTFSASLVGAADTLDPAEPETADRLAVGIAPTPALSGARAIVRALRPLHRKTLSRRTGNVVLDEEATAERAARDGLWLPQTKQATERWLDLTLVVDAGPSMALWRSSLRAFETVLEQLGTFRTIQRCLLDVRPGADSRPKPILRGGTPSAPVHGRTALVDPGGRRLVLVVTDGISPYWGDPAFTSVLARWGRSMSTAVVHMLPQRLWRQGGLDPHRARVSSRPRLNPNSRWSVTLPDAWLESDPGALLPKGTVPVPIFELDARWLRGWARLIAGGNNDPVDATVLLTHELAPPPGGQFGAEKPLSAPTPHEQVRTFLATASRPARQLARLLAAVPVSLSAARLIQRELAPGGPENIAEVLASGLFRPSGGGREPWDKITFALHPEVRQELLGGARRSETVRVIKMITSQLGNHSGAFGNLSEALDAPDSTPDPPLSAENAELVELQRIVLRALNGPYLARAERLPRPVAAPDTPSNQPTPTTTPVSSKMHDAAERTGLVAEATRPTSPPGTPPAAPVSLPGAPGAATLSAATPPVSLLDIRTFERPSPDIPAIWGNIPPRNPNFTGREEPLKSLGQQLAAGGPTAVLPSALYGMGGIGKTQMAVEYVYRHVRDYDLVWWVQASDASLIRSDLAELARALQLPGSGEINTAVPVVREALRRGQPVRRWLLVFDAADSMDTVREFFPNNGPGHILITSRNPDWVSVAQPLEIATFTRPESIQLLSRRGPAIETDEEKQDANRLAEVLGDLPLAIEQAAAWRAETGMPVQEYLRLFDEKVAEIKPETAPTGYELSVAAAWTVSFEELGKHNPAANQLLQVCAFFSPEPISRHLFNGVGRISIAPELDRALRDPLELSRAIRAIGRYGLAKIDHRKETLQLHRLVQLVLRNRMTPQFQADMRHGAHLLLMNVDPNDPLSSSQRQRYQEVLPHANASRLVECEDVLGRHLVINLMAFLYRWGDHTAAIQMAEDALRKWQKSLGERDRQTLDVAGRLGYYYWVTGRYAEAKALNSDTLAIRREVDGENAEETVTAQLAVVADRRAAGEFAAASDLSAEVYQKTRALFGDDDPVTLTAARIYCICLRLVGEYWKAADLDKATFDQLTEVRGQEHPETLSTLAGWILDRRETGDYIWAWEQQEKLALLAKQIHGEDKADTLRRFAYLAVARRKAGRHRDALSLSTEVLERFRRRYGLDNFNAMACALGRSIDLRHDGDLRSAKELGEEIFQRYERNMGPVHPYTVCANVDIAVTLRLLGDVGEARRRNEESLVLLRTKLGNDHVHAIVCAINLASDRAALGETDAAVELGVETLERAERVLGLDHPTTLAASLNLVLDLRAMDRGTEAASRYSDLLGRYSRVLGEQHPATLAAAKGVRAECDIDPLPL